MPHTIFLFDVKSIKQVFPAFGALLLETFPDQLLRSGAFTARAIGRVGKAKEAMTKPLATCVITGMDMSHAPRSWNHAHIRLLTSSTLPSAGSQCGRLCRVGENSNQGDNRIGGNNRPCHCPSRGQATRWLWESLKDDETAAKELRNCIWRWCGNHAHYEQDWCNQVEELRQSIRPIIGKQWNKVTSFLSMVCGFCRAVESQRRRS